MTKKQATKRTPPHPKAGKPRRAKGHTAKAVKPDRGMTSPPPPPPAKKGRLSFHPIDGTFTYLARIKAHLDQRFGRKVTTGFAIRVAIAEYSATLPKEG